MKLAIFSDIHGNLEALNSILKDIKEKQVDEVLCLGDVLGIGPNPKECLREIILNNVRLILGNHELYYLKDIYEKDMSKEELRYLEWEKEQLDFEDKRFLNTRPLSLVYDKILFTHFLIEDEQKEIPYHSFEILKDENLKEYAFDSIYLGHWHRHFIKDKIFCLGSSGCVPTDITFYHIIDTTMKTYQKIEIPYDRDTFVKKIKENDYPGRNFVAKVFFGISS